VAVVRGSKKERDESLLYLNVFEEKGLEIENERGGLGQLVYSGCAG
jgi:hypothetical protein